MMQSARSSAWSLGVGRILIHMDMLLHSKVQKKRDNQYFSCQFWWINGQLTWNGVSNHTDFPNIPLKMQIKIESIDCQVWEWTPFQSNGWSLLVNIIMTTTCRASVSAAKAFLKPTEWNREWLEHFWEWLKDLSNPQSEFGSGWSTFQTGRALSDSTAKWIEVDDGVTYEIINTIEEKLQRLTKRWSRRADCLLMRQVWSGNSWLREWVLRLELRGLHLPATEIQHIESVRKAAWDIRTATS